MIKRFKIKHAKNIVNFDETGARVGCAGSEDVIVLTEVMELCEASPENRKSVTICEAIYADGSGEKVIEAWIAYFLLL